MTFLIPFPLMSGQRYLFTSGSVLRAKWPPHADIENKATPVERLLQTTDRGSLPTFGLTRLNIHFDLFSLAPGTAKTGRIEMPLCRVH